MDIIRYWFEGTVDSAVASVPLIIVFLLLKRYKLPAKKTVPFLILNILVSIYFWLKIGDVFLALYQCVSYISGFIWLWAENVLEKRQAEKENSDNLL